MRPAGRVALVPLGALFLAPTTLVVACYDVDRLRAERDRPFDAAAEMPDERDRDADAAIAADVTPDAAGICPSPFPSPSDGLVAFYPLDETSGVKVNDCSGNALDAVVIASDGKWVPGRNGGGLRLSSIDGCAQIGTVASAASLDFKGSFTAAVWINVASFPPAGSTAGYIVGKTRDPDNAGWRLATGAAGVSATVSLPNNTRLDVNTTIGKGVWVHVAAVATAGGSLDLYIDGSMRASQPGVPNPIEADPAAAARLGCRSDGAQAFDGIVDDVRLFSRALTPAEIATLAK